MANLFCGFLAVLWAVAAPAAAAPRYAARQSGDVVELSDTERETEVKIIPSAGNIAFEFSIKGQNVLRWPYASLDDFKAKPGLAGIPLLAPFANRLDEPAFYANGKRFPFDLELGNVRAPIPIHGFLQYAQPWRVVEAKADAGAAWVTSRLEFFREPAWMKQWPFAHTIEITHLLRDGSLEVRTTIANMSAERMPIAIGFHPYFQLTDSPRDEWTIAVGARTRWLLAPNKVPTGETEPIERFLPAPKAAPLREYNLDDVFGDLERDAEGRATMSVIGKAQRLDIVQGPNYRAMVIYSPQKSNFICFEPMAGITNAINLAHKGVYKELQSVEPGGTWSESFWVKPSGFGQESRAPQPSVTLPADLARVLTDYEAAWQKKDAAALARLFADDRVVVPNACPPVRGRAAVEKCYSGSGGPLSLRAIAFGTDGRLGYIIGAFADRKDAPDAGKFTLTLVKGGDGRWLIVSDMDRTYPRR